MSNPSLPSLHDVADPALCHFCGGNRFEWEGSWGMCLDCTASIRHSGGQVADTEPPDNWDAVSDLLHELRGI